MVAAQHRANDGEARAEPPLLTLRACSKTFAGQRVLRDVDLEVRAGEVHALLGQNGSGKSTLIKILSGYHEADAGATLLVGNEPVPLPLTPESSRGVKLAFVHQDLALADSISALENVRIGRFDTGRGWRIRWRSERRQVQDALERAGLTFSVLAPVSSLREVERAMLAVVRALEDLRRAGGRGVLILDEATAYLPHDNVQRLLRIVRDAARTGVGLIFVTHRLAEVLEVADRVTVLRDGAVVTTATVRGVSEGQLIEWILGATTDTIYPEAHEPATEVVLAVTDVNAKALNSVSFRVHRGEVLGLTGLAGMGWERLPYVLFGDDPSASGQLTICGKTYNLASFRPHEAIGAGLALIPANRHRDGGVGLATVKENISLPTLGRFVRRRVLSRRKEIARTRELMADFDVRPAKCDLPFSMLSGGNQQKALLAKWFETVPAVFLMHEPSQGVDIGARKRIFAQIAKSADAGGSFILASAEYEDLIHLCDRVLVFREGGIGAELSGAGLTLERLVSTSLESNQALKVHRCDPNA